jgi:hypothetical protein
MIWEEPTQTHQTHYFVNRINDKILLIQHIFPENMAFTLGIMCTFMSGRFRLTNRRFANNNFSIESIHANQYKVYDSFGE